MIEGLVREVSIERQITRGPWWHWERCSAVHHLKILPSGAWGLIPLCQFTMIVF